MTPCEYKVFEQVENEKVQALAEAWIPRGDKKLRTFIKEMEPFALHQNDVPLIIKLVENPKYFTSRLFTGAVDLFTHDCIHILLGRGVLLKDEAFVIGYTMGSSKKMKRWRRNLFMFCAKYLYPKGYKFKEEERFIFNLGVVAGSKCDIDLSTVNFEEMLDMRISEIRGNLQISYEIIKHCYGLEKKCFKSVESARLLQR
jgi:hypothetical protein